MRAPEVRGREAPGEAEVLAALLAVDVAHLCLMCLFIVSIGISIISMFSSSSSSSRSTSSSSSSSRSVVIVVLFVVYYWVISACLLD